MSSTFSREMALRTRERLAKRGIEWLETDSLGELELRVYFGRGTTSQAAQRAAEGWDGDVLELYRDDAGELSVLWLTRWDTTLDAKEAASAAKAVLASESPETRRRGAVVRAGKRVLIVRGFAPESLTAVSAWALASQAPAP